MLLLIVLLSDAISVQRSLGNLSGCGTQPARPQSRFNKIRSPVAMPPTVLSPLSEYRRMFEQLSGALEKWETTFQAVVCPNDIALYFFCRLYLTCPQLSVLPRLAGFSPAVHATGMQKEGDDVDPISIPDESVKYAWAVLDKLEGTSAAGQFACPVWCPYIVFMSGLVVWASTRRQDNQTVKPSSMKQLLAFKIELDKMTWPCCQEMSLTLNGLLHKGDGPAG